MSHCGSVRLTVKTSNGRLRVLHLEGSPIVASLHSLPRDPFQIVAGKGTEGSQRGARDVPLSESDA
jgi:hypothetical protein